MQDITTRRAVLSGAVASVAIVAAGPTAASSKTPARISPALENLIAAFRAAEQAADHHATAVYNPCLERHKAAVAAAEAALPHTSIDLGPSLLDPAVNVIWSTDNSTTLAMARGVVGTAKADPGRDSPAMVASARKLVAADLRRQRAISRVARSTGLTAASAESDRLSSKAAAAMCAVGAHSVSTAADLAAKLAFMVEHQMGDGMDWLEELHADALRIAKMEAAA